MTLQKRHRRKMGRTPGKNAEKQVGEACNSVDQGKSRDPVEDPGG
eukprot:gene12958-3721_t